MNAVGIIGEFIIEYQYEIEVGLLILLGLIMLFAVIRAFVRAARRKSVLEEINEKVDDIGHILMTISAELENDESEACPAENISPAPDEGIEEREEPKPEEPKQDVKDEEIPKRYFSRDCAVDKKGNRYTLEELNTQIQ